MEDQLSMSQSFIERLNDILEKNYQDENFGVKELASTAGISRSNLHRKLQRIDGVTASQFIRVFRLQKAHKLLQNNVSTVSEIAYAVGFNSPSYFTKCFHEYYNYLPGEVKNKKEDLIQVRKTSNSTVSNNFKRNIVVIALLFLIAIISFWVLYKSRIKVDETKTHSIAVLPFKNFSDDQSNQYFADGVMDVILSHLSSIENFNVISRTTMEQYRVTTKTIPEIADELNVTYILEASVQKYKDKIRIVVQLIDGIKDVHIWSDDYERDYEDIFLLQSNIAKEVAKQLKTKVSPKELMKIEQITTENFEAYNLYLKGRFFWHRRTKEDLEKSIHYFEQAIALDSNYALAYAGLADAYFIKSWWAWDENYESQIKGKEYALKALSIDTTLSHAYATLGGISTYFDWNWDQAEKELKRAILLNPNYATAYQYYAELLDILGKSDKAREQINLALKHNPNSSSALNISADIYYNSGNFEKAIEDSKRSSEIKVESKDYDYVKYYIGIGQDQKAFEHFKKILPDSIKNSSEIDSEFKNGGISKVISNYIPSSNFHKRDYYLSLASLYSLAEEDKKALDYLEKSYKAREPQLPRMNSKLEFKRLKTEPRFITLLEKMNLK